MKFKIKRLIQVEQIVDIPVNDIKDDTHLKGRIAVLSESILHEAITSIRKGTLHTIDAHGVKDAHLQTEIIME